MFKNKLDFVAMDAPHVVPKGTQNEAGDSCRKCSHRQIILIIRQKLTN